MYLSPWKTGWPCHFVVFLLPLLRLLMDSFVSFCWVGHPESGSNLTGFFLMFFCGCEVGEWNFRKIGIPRDRCSQLKEMGFFYAIESIEVTLCHRLQLSGKTGVSIALRWVITCTLQQFNGRTEQSKIREQLCVCVFQGKPDMSNRDFLRLCILAATLEVFVTKGFEIADISQKLLSMYDACMQTIISISVRPIWCVKCSYWPCCERHKKWNYRSLLFVWFLLSFVLNDLPL